MKTKTIYCVDIVDCNASQSIATVYQSENSDEAHDVAIDWNKKLLDPKCIWHTQANLSATVYEVEEEIEEEKEMKKFTLENYKEFCDEALIMPPFEEDGDIETWFDNHKIQIIANDCMIELDYDADAVNEIDFALREIHEAILGSGIATTGNTAGSEYRPAELKDILRVAIQHDWEEWGYKHEDLITFLREFVKRCDDITNIMGVYDDIIYKDIKWYNTIMQCNFGKLDMLSLKHIDRPHIQKVIEDLVCTEKELLVGYDSCNRCSDITFIMDHTFKSSGELIAWFYGEADDDYIGALIKNYKNRLFKEE